MLDDRLSQKEDEELSAEDIYDIHDIFSNVEEAIEVMSKKNPERSISDIASDIENETFVYPNRRDDLKYRTYEYYKFESTNRIAIVEYY